MYLFFNYRSQKATLLILLPLFTYLYISKKDRNPSHYFIFMYPLIVGYAVLILDNFSSLVSKELAFVHLKVPKKALFYALFLFVLSVPLFSSIRHSYVLSQPDTRNLAYEWLQNNLTRKDQIYYYRGELEQIPYIDLKAKKVRRLDIENIDMSKAPFYLFIGVHGVTYDDLMTGDRDTDLIEGNVSKFIENSDLVFYAEPKNQEGPPVFIFKVYGLESN
ncbi:MAG TPA: hypothetical protein ENJ78_00100 [candidate division WWE3 bacterium]|uniref:DUF2079 domain-containing protein n=1 Tax=candidate division WWE3 bacterium TaxID=2053526 RepID=A0A7V5IZZ4_UNCKA|nr:hypothetical protein [candidate division WWE3 bacterium]